MGSRYRRAECEQGERKEERSVNKESGKGRKRGKEREQRSGKVENKKRGKKGKKEKFG